MRTISAALAHKLRAHACRFAMLPEVTVESAAADDEKIRAWSDEAYKRDLRKDRIA